MGARMAMKGLTVAIEFKETELKSLASDTDEKSDYI